MTRDDSDTSSYRFQELDEAECKELLRLKRIGRIVWCGVEPQCLPVNYVVHEDQILFRTSPYSVVAQVASQRTAAFEVDDIDEFVGTGWSLLVVGEPTRVDDPSKLPRALADRPYPWAPGTRNLYLSLRPHKITGRRVVSEI
jgi:nitroimidazol reductase NimA-like FMN-containing flavoprotein (pyridoxamine 5'-phosphate oxidase superfamily)